MPSSYAVGERFEQFIREQVQSGRYSSASEVVREALRLLEAHESMRLVALVRLRGEIRAGFETGPPTPADAVLDRLERKYAAMAEERVHQ